LPSPGSETTSTSSAEELVVVLALTTTPEWPAGGKEEWRCLKLAYRAQEEPRSSPPHIPTGFSVSLGSGAGSVLRTRVVMIRTVVELGSGAIGSLVGVLNEFPSE
jgi:hypothetical protein